jgi:CHAD domain-containing protein
MIPDAIEHEKAPSFLDCQTVFQEIARNCVGQLQTHRKSAIASDPDAIHSMRIALTELRATAIFFPMTSDDAWHGIKKELRWLNRALGRARNHDVTVNYARRKLYRRWARPSRRSLMRARGKSHRRLSRKLNSARYDQLIKRINEWISNGRWLLSEQSIRCKRVDIYAGARLRGSRTVIFREGQHLRRLHPKELHRLRIRCKHYRYVVTALQSFRIPLTHQDLMFRDTAKHVQSALGDLRDLKRLREAAHGRPPGYRRSKRKLVQRAENSLQPSG